MTLFNYKKIISFLMIFAVALATGFSIGKIYIDQNALPSMTGSESDYREDEETVKKLVLSSDGKSVMQFNGIELFQIAEYKLQNESVTPNFLKESIGVVTSTGVDVYMRSQKVRVGDDYTYYKLSPSQSVLGIETPQVCMRVRNNSKTGKIDVVDSDQGKMTNRSSSETLDAEFPANGSAYTEESYAELFKTKPTTVMNYIVSNKTSEGCASEVVDNGDGTYSFELNYKNKGGAIDAAFCYSYEILFSSGYSLPKWDSAKLKVTINSDFTFKEISYLEKYTMVSDKIPVLGKASVVNNFTDYFYYDIPTISEKVLPDFKTFAEVE